MKFLHDPSWLGKVENLTWYWEILVSRKKKKCMRRIDNGDGCVAVLRVERTHKSSRISGSSDA